MVTSKVSSKGRVTIPKELREELGIEPGDKLSFEKDDEGLKLRVIKPFDEAYHESIEGTMTEWMSDEDEEAYADL